MRSLLSASPPDGAYITPHEIMAELAELAATMNALDRDNLESEGLDETHAEEGAWNVVQTDPIEDVQVTSHESGQEGSVYPIPDASGAPWVLEHPSTDTTLEVSLSVTAQLEAGVQVWVGVRVNGRLFRSPWSRSVAATAYESWLLRASSPVGAGTAIIEAVYGTRSTTDATPPWAVTWQDRRLTIRELVR